MTDSRHSCQINRPDYHASLSTTEKTDNRDGRTCANNDTLTPRIGLLQCQHVCKSHIADVDPRIRVEQFLL